MNEEKVSGPSIEDFIHGIKSGTNGESGAWVALAAYLFWRRGTYD